MLRVTRRRFLGALGATLVSPRVGTGETTETSPVWISTAAAEEAIPRLLDAIPRARTLLVSGARVVVKPNISWPNPDAWATTTSPSVLKAVVRCCLDRGAASVVVLDNPLGDSERCVIKTGAQEALQGLPNTRLVLLTRPRDFAPKPLPLGSQLPEVEIARELLRATCVINLPKAKAHSATGVSFGLKNLMGLIRDRQVFHRGATLHKAIAELLHVVRPHLTLMDATTVLTSRGPQGPGSVSNPGVLAAAEDPVALDAYACSLDRWDGRALDPSDVAHIAHASSLGLGNEHYHQVSI